MVEDDLRKKMTVLQYQNIKEFCEFYTYIIMISLFSTFLKHLL